MRAFSLSRGSKQHPDLEKNKAEFEVLRVLLKKLFTFQFCGWLIL